MRPEVKSPATQTFRARLTFFFALTAAMTAVILSVMLAFTWEGQFQSYTRDNMQRLADSTAQVLSRQYEAQGGWNRRVLTYASSASAASTDVGVQVVDESGEVIYDDTWALSRRSGHTGPTPVSDVTNIDPDSVVISEVITSEGDKVGEVRLWAFGSDALLTKSDAAFRQNSYSAIFMAAMVAVGFACVIGYFTSRSLTRPIKIITSTAAQIRSGDLTARTKLTGEDEIGQLGETFDSMATTLEHDIKIEHRLTSDVAHELRTPLMAMLVTVEAMQDGVLPADDEHLETVASETRRLSRLVDAMLHLSRIENGKGSLKFERTDMVYLVRSLVSSQHQLFHEKGLHLRFANETPRDELYADVDPDLIREAIVNLMSNAMRYTSSGGWVLVTLAYERPEVVIMVQDTGMGIAKEDISRIFSRFWRSDASRERVSGGLGVGLAITKEIVDQHNGTITVESELGKGTLFSIRFPQDHGRRTLSQAIQEG
ncbi:MAG: HAMP domain-containing histidine kinase [Atopobiaceae bacterium]|nr:HAMP domain-containing histidine kinase [Atopobiaceae bacterium]